MSVSAYIPGFYLQPNDPPNGTIYTPKVKEFLDKTALFSRCIFQPEEVLKVSTPAAYLGIVKLKLSYKSWTFINYNHSHKRSEDNKNALLFLLATIVGGIFIYRIGVLINAHREAKENVKEIKEFRKLVEIYEQEMTAQNNGFKPVNHRHLNLMEQAANESEKISKEIRRSIQQSLALAISMVASAIIVAVGALFSLELLMIGGIVAMTITAGIWIFKWSYERSDKRQVALAEKIYNAVHELLTAEYTLGLSQASVPQLTPPVVFIQQPQYA